MDRGRYWRIMRLFIWIFVRLLWWEIILPFIGLKKLARRTRPKRLQRIARDYHDLAVKLGGVLIKMGQFLSSRLDILPDDITEELAGLQDEVPAEDFDGIRKLAEAELGAALEERFERFEPIPLAAASLGQVHTARLKAADEEVGISRDVVVKIQRPEIETIIATDMRAIQWAGNMLMKYRPISQRANVPALLGELTRVLYQEIDYLAEGRNAQLFGENFAEDAGVRVPKVVWSQTTKRVLTLEDVYAIKITDYEQISAAGVDRVEVAERLFDTYMRQIFVDGFFHADPHPGNLFVEPRPEEEGGWQLTFVDFGMAGHVPPNMRAGLQEFAIGLGTKDSARLVKAYKMLGVLLPHADLSLLEQAEAAAFDRFWGKSMDELRTINFDEMHEFAKEFRELVFSMPFQVPQDLIFLFRCVAILAGICTGLDPQFNLWVMMEPYAKKLMAKEGSSAILSEVGAFLQTLLALPRKTETLLDKLNRGGLQVQVPAAERRLNKIDRTLRRLVYAVLFFALLTNGVMLYLSGELIFAGVLLAGALGALLGAILPRPHEG